MIAFSKDGFYSASMILMIWGLTDKKPTLMVLGLALWAVSFWPSFFRQFDHE